MPPEAESTSVDNAEHAAIDAFLQVAGLLPEALLLVSREGAVVAANRAAEDLLVGATGPLAGRNLETLLLDSPSAVHSYLGICARTRTLIPGTLTLDRSPRDGLALRAEGGLFQRRSGNLEPLIVLRLTVKDAAVERFVELNRRIDALSEEVHRRRRIEAELCLQREWFRVVLTSIGDAVIATDLQGRVSFMNPLAETLTGWAQDEARGHPLREVFRIVNEDTREEVENPAEKVLREGIVVGLANHTVLVGRDGLEWPIDDSAAPIRGEDGALQGVVLIFREIRDRRRMERELHARAESLALADRRKDEFLAMLAHELRNPMAPLANVVEVLRAGESPTPDALWAVEILERQIAHMRRLVDDLLDVSRVTLGKITLDRRITPLSRIVEHALETVHPLMERKSHVLTVAMPPRMVMVDADPARISQVLSNLLNNAAKYTDDGGRIELAADVRNGWVEIRVRDNGIGIEANLLDHVFEPFTQSEGGLDRSQGGLGIGLALVRTLVELHGGTVHVRSEGRGQGCEFLVCLPEAVETTLEVVEACEAAPATPARTVARRVLIVDDNLDATRSLAKLLSRWGHHVRVAHDGPEGLEAFASYQPEIVFLDIGLPGMDGYQVARHVKSVVSPEGEEPPMLVALSGYGQANDRLRAEEAGFDRYLVKPVDPDDLRSILGATTRG